ncbi:unnamed protein product [Linum trigynum]|uniref:Fe2OG dioxygenase domain-containing protein n=1 Tax=Linum trigynum TaxID=586398 RepID=A0AAV2DY01_9ROSI
MFLLPRPIQAVISTVPAIRRIIFPLFFSTGNMNCGSDEVVHGVSAANNSALGTKASNSKVEAEQALNSFSIAKRGYSSSNRRRLKVDLRFNSRMEDSAAGSEDCGSSSLPTQFGKKKKKRLPAPALVKRSKSSERFPKSIVNANDCLLDLEPFDICQREETSSDSLQCPGNVDRLTETPSTELLRPGMVLLKYYITHDSQVEIVKTCRELGLGRGGFYRPGFQDGAKLRLYMMCLGLNWDPETRGYNKRRPINNVEALHIPDVFKVLVGKAIEDAHEVIRKDGNQSNVEDLLPGMTPDICIVNFYAANGRLGLHQDRDESRESLDRGLPVVSISIGDSAEFLYGDTRNVNEAKRVMLESGDVLIFGGKSRHVFHGVASIIPDSAPTTLVRETGMRQGRLNLTFRQY